MWKVFKVNTEEEVNLGDIIDGESGKYKVNHFMPPHKPSSSGKVSVFEMSDPEHMEDSTGPIKSTHTRVYYIGVIDCEYRWVGNGPIKY